MDDLEFIVPGTPKGKGRPRFAKRGNFVQTYTPQDTLAYEDQIKFYATKAGAKPVEDKEVYLTISAVFPVPQSKPGWWKGLADDGLMPMTKKPDLDNIVKVTLDGLNGIAFKDDSMVVSIDCRKDYGKEPHLSVRLAFHDLPTRKSTL